MQLMSQKWLRIDRFVEVLSGKPLHSTYILRNCSKRNTATKTNCSAENRYTCYARYNSDKCFIISL